MPRTYRIPLDLDAPRVAAALTGLAQAPGTVRLRRDGAARLGWDVPASVVLFDPRWTLSVEASGAREWTGTPPPAGLGFHGPLEIPGRLATLLAPRPAGDPAGRGGLPVVAGWIGYDAGSAALGGRHREPAPGLPPDAWIAAYDCALVLAPEGVELVVTDVPALFGDVRDRDQERVLRGHARLERARDLVLAAAQRPVRRVEHDPRAQVECFDADWHRRAVHTIHDHLRAGDSYQINLTGFTRLRTARSAWEVFETECARNPVGFAAYLNTGRHVVTSHSPELLLRARHGHALTAPIKGTAAAAPFAATQLRTSEKDRAEHVMIVDLSRNDLGRGARPGSVRVDALMRPLALRGLVHLVSEVSADLRSDAMRTVFADLFPGGSITGAPKRRSCAILRELERSGRGPYTGAIGFVDGTGGMDWNIAIRTALWHNGDAWFGCGGGIVLDSDPDREFEEAMLKAQSFLASARGCADPASHLLAGSSDPLLAPPDGVS